LTGLPWKILSLPLVLTLVVSTPIGGLLKRRSMALAIPMVVEKPVTPKGKLLPQPTITYRYTSSTWDKLAWNYQYAQSIRAWHQMMRDWNGTDAGLATLARTTIEMRELQIQAGGHPYNQSPFSRSAWKSVKADANALNAKHSLNIGTWAKAEDQFLAGNVHQNWDWQPWPMGVLKKLAESSDPQIRTFVLDRATVDPRPEAGELVQSMLDDDDNTVATRAEQGLLWRKSLWNWNP